MFILMRPNGARVILSRKGRSQQNAEATEDQTVPANGTRKQILPKAMESEMNSRETKAALARAVNETAVAATRIPVEEAVREGVRLLKQRFLAYRNPPVDLPAESVIEDAVRAIFALAGASWQPIETAPKRGYIIGAWKDGKWTAKEMWWDDSVEEWTDATSDRYLRPTHWAPSPENPAADGG